MIWLTYQGRISALGITANPGTNVRMRMRMRLRSDFAEAEREDRAVDQPRENLQNSESDLPAHT